MLEITPTLSLDEREIEERFVRASVRAARTSTRSRRPWNCASTSARRRCPGRQDAARRAGRQRLTRDGMLVIDSREHRTQARTARRRGHAWSRSCSRRRTARSAPADQAGQGQREQRLGEKRERSKVKAGRQRRPPATTAWPPRSHASRCTRRRLRDALVATTSGNALPTARRRRGLGRWRRAAGRGRRVHVAPGRPTFSRRRAVVGGRRVDRAAASVDSRPPPWPCARTPRGQSGVPLISTATGA